MLEHQPPGSTPTAPQVLAGTSGQKKDVDMFNNITSVSLLSVEDLARILGLGEKTIYLKLYRSPSSLPPRFFLPGSRLVRWHPTVVARWMDNLAGLTSSPSPFQSEFQKKKDEKEKRSGPGRPRKKEVIERERRGGV